MVHASSRSTRGHSLKLRKVQCSIEVRRHSFALRVVNHWNGLPERAVQSTSLTSFKAGLHEALGKAFFEV